MAKLIVLPKADFQQLLLDLEEAPVVVFTTQEILDEAGLSEGHARRLASAYDTEEADCLVELARSPEHEFFKRVLATLPDTES